VSLPGAGAFGGDGPSLAERTVEEIANALSGGANSSGKFKEVLLYGPPDWYTKSLEKCSKDVKEKVQAVGFGKEESKNRIGELSAAGQQISRVIVAGFDPVSLVPHGVKNRAISLEGQLSHATDLLYRMQYYKTPGKEQEITVASGPVKGAEKAPDYKAWRYLEGEVKSISAEERQPNGDSLSGWRLGK